MAYCRELVFRAKTERDIGVREMRWDCERLKQLLADNSFDGDLNDVVYNITQFTVLAATASVGHFFEVELIDVRRVHNDILLSEPAVRRYLSQVAPVPFTKGFRFATRINKHLTKFNAAKSYNIYLNGDTKRVERPFTNSFAVKQTQTDKFSEFESFEVPGVHGDIDAVGWLLHHNYYGSLPEQLGIGGLRLRVGNVQVGPNNIFETAFSEARFNSWCVGEVCVVGQRLLPNARRDDLEHSVHQQNLLNHISCHAKRVSRLCRKKSAERNKAVKPSKHVAWTLTPAELGKLSLCPRSTAATMKKVLSVLGKAGIAKDANVVDALLRAGMTDRSRCNRRKGEALQYVENSKFP